MIQKYSLPGREVSKVSEKLVCSEDAAVRFLCLHKIYVGIQVN